MLGKIAASQVLCKQPDTVSENLLHAFRPAQQSLLIWTPWGLRGSSSWNSRTHPGSNSKTSRKHPATCSSAIRSRRILSF